MIRAVLDTNVLASAIVALRRPESILSALIQAWLARRFTLVISNHILLRELPRTLNKPYFRRYLTTRDIVEALLDIAAGAEGAPITADVRGVATHPEDDLVLATAVSARADYLVTGDLQLQRLGSYEGVTLVSPRAFLDLLPPTSE